MSSPQELYTAFVAAMNNWDWYAAECLVTPTVTVNGVDMPARTLIQRVSVLSNIGSALTTTIDYLLPSPCGTKAFSRVIHRFTLEKEVWGVKVTGSPIEFSESSFVFTTDGKISEIYTILDIDGMRRGRERIPRVARSMAAEVSAPDELNLLASYKAYVECVQQGPTVEQLSKYCNQTIIVNNEELTLEQFVTTIEAAKAAIEGMHWNLEEAIVDDEKQQIASRVMLTGTPVKDFAGTAPNGRSVEFPEHVLYQFERGKVVRMSQLMDLDTYRRCLESWRPPSSPAEDAARLALEGKNNGY